MASNRLDSKEIAEIHIIPYAHHDFAWTNSRQWHIQRYLQCFVEVLDLMRKNKDITWLIDNVIHSLIPFIKHCPERVEELKMRVKEGRIFIANGGISLARSAYVGEETFIRNIMDGKLFFQKMFDIDNIEVFYNADVGCGHSQLPQILLLGGHKYYRFQRPEEALDCKNVPRQFIWKGLDGSRIIASRGSYIGFRDGNYTNKDFQNQWEEIRQEFFENELKDKVDHLLAAGIIWLNYGGDDTRPLYNARDKSIRILEFVDEWNKHENIKLLFSTPGLYFKCLETKKLPIYEGLLDPCELSFNSPIRGNYSMWRMRSDLECLIVETESIATFAALAGGEYPEQEIEHLWKDLFEITGHAIEWALKNDFDELYSIALAARISAILLIRKLCDQIAGKVQTEKGIQFIAFNILNWSRDEIVKLHITSPFGVKGFDLFDNSGNAVDYQIAEVYSGDKQYAGYEYNSVDVFAKVYVPAMGYTGLRAEYNGKSIMPKVEAEFIDYFENRLTADPENMVINNGELEVTLKKGIITKIQEISSGAFIHNDNFQKVINGLKFYKTIASTTWLSSWEHSMEFSANPKTWGMIENGPIRWVCRISGSLGCHTFTMDVILQKGERAVGFDLEIDSTGEEGYFAAEFSSDSGTHIYADIPFGVEERDLKQEYYQSMPGRGINYNSVERGWPGQFYAKNWTMFNYCEKSLSIVSQNCSIYYNHSQEKNVISLVLNRCMPLDNKEERWLRQTHPSIEGKGRHNFKYFIYFPQRDGKYSDVVRFLKTKVQPVEVVAKFNYNSEDGLKIKRSFINTDRENIIVSAFYKQGDHYILRLFETDGIFTNTKISLDIAFCKAVFVDFLGNKLDDIKYSVDLSSRVISVDIKPWQIVNLFIEYEDVI